MERFFVIAIKLDTSMFFYMPESVAYQSLKTESEHIHFR